MAAPARRHGVLAVFAATALMLAAGTVYLLAPRPAGGGGLADAVTIGGPFSLTTHAGARFSDADLKGRPYAVFFGFTHCPEVCPTTLWEMSEALTALGPDGERLTMLFVSVDPERDTPELLARFLQSFHPSIIGLTGSEAEIDAIGKAYRAYWRKVPTAKGDYTVDHTASVYLMDADGRFSGTISYGEQMQARLQKLRNLAAGTGA